MKSYPYQIIGGKNHEESLFFMLNVLLHSRIEIGEETTDDEDVNMYLAMLLHEFVDFDFFAEKGQFVSRYEMDVAALADRYDSLGMKYHVYRSNADYALMSASIFEPMQEVHTHRIPHEGAWVERGKTYYRFAASCHERFKHKHTAVSEVLEKLSDRLELYMAILKHVRVAYLNLLKRLTRGEIYHIQRRAQHAPVFASISDGRDQFLDAYGDWMRTRTELDREQVNILGRALAVQDPNFRFEGI